MQRLLKRPTDRHRFADAFHLRGQRWLGLRKFLEREPRHLDHAVIDRRLEAGRRFAGDIVLDFVQRVTDGQLGRDFCNGKAGRFACVVRMDRELNVRPARLDTDLANDRERGVPHHLVFFVG